MMKLRYLVADISRHGQTRFYVRLPGRAKIRLQVDRMDDPQFGLAYAAALNGERWQPKTMAVKPQEPSDKPIPGSLRALCVQYFTVLDNDPMLADITKANRRKFLEEVCREPPQPGSTKVMGDMPIGRFDATHVQAIVDRRVKTPEAANVRRKAISALFQWAIPRGYAKGANPATVGGGSW
jgi:hypothetical protein